MQVDDNIMLSRKVNGGFAVKILQFLVKFAVFLPQISYICTRNRH